ncbi:PIN domain nuclease [Sphingomonas sp. HHU CXW]|uniref:Ribonuclease VapC n=1 Tax=Sphingomonas hominis TaxID=2741495 RepID=A0ABX2JG80_9SPHN|nr:PIN domain nuclease [Sphingomonas hominis]NTS63626.1 PIN domain nuclease [Sphingomonas hominis]
MILPDSSVWIDLLAGRDTPQANLLRRLLDDNFVIAVGDLILTEVLQGTRSERHYQETLAVLSAFEQVTLVNRDIAIEAARNYQHLRGLGITIRKTIDTLIATRCIHDAIPLLYSDRDYDPFVQYLGLRSAMDLDLGVA